MIQKEHREHEGNTELHICVHTVKLCDRKLMTIVHL
jgi:hypothetical protein